jgi:hypothetical protein
MSKHDPGSGEMMSEDEFGLRFGAEMRYTGSKTNWIGRERRELQGGPIRFWWKGVDSVDGYIRDDKTKLGSSGAEGTPVFGR